MRPQPKDEFSQIHPKLGREVYRGILQVELADKLAGRRVQLAGGFLVDTETGEVLDTEPGEDPGLYLAAGHALAASNDFRWLGFRLPSDARGEVGSVPLGGALHCMSDRVDPSYQARLAGRARKQIGQALSRAWTRLRGRKILGTKRYRERMATLTAPSLDSTSRLEEWQFHNDAFERLRETAWFRERVWGGTKSLEDSGQDRPHVHSHGIWLCLYLPQTVLAWLWTGVAIAQRRADAGNPEAFSDPRQHWVDKGWTAERLEDIEGTVVTARKSAKKAKTLAERDYWEDQVQVWSNLLAAIRRDCYVVDVRLITDKRTGEYTVDRSSALAEVGKYVTKTTDYMDRPLPDLLGLLLPPRAPRVFDCFGACRDGAKWEQEVDPFRGLEAAVAVEGRTSDPASLDTAAINSGAPGAEPPPIGPLEEAETPQKASKPPPRRPRPPSWRVLQKELSLTDWIAVMQARARSSSDWAMRRLKKTGIYAATVAEVLEWGEFKDPFVYESPARS